MDKVIEQASTGFPSYLWVIIVAAVVIFVGVFIRVVVKVLSSNGGKLEVNFKDKSVKVEKGENTQSSEEKHIFTEELLEDKKSNACDDRDCMQMRAVEVLQLMEKLEEYLNDKWMIRLKLSLRDQMKVVEGKLRYMRGMFYSCFLKLLKDKYNNHMDITNCSEAYMYGRMLDGVFDVLKSAVRERCTDDSFEKISDKETDKGLSDWHTYKQNAWEDLQAMATAQIDIQYPHFMDITRKDVYNANIALIKDNELKVVILKTFNTLRDIAINYEQQITIKKTAYQDEVKKVFKA